MKQETIMVYKFKELKKDVQEKVIEKFRNYRYEDGFITEQLDEDIQYWLTENFIPFENKSICFDLTHYKGYPYISWNGRFDKINIEKFLKKNRMFTKFKELFKGYLCVSIDNKNEYRININIDYEDELQECEEEVRNAIILKERERLNALFLNFEEYMQIRIEQIRADITKESIKSYEDYFTDDNIIEDIKANEYNFLENGERW